MSRRRIVLGALLSLGLTLALSADRVWVTNLAGNTIVFFDSGSNALLGTVTVGDGPIDIAADRAADPQRLFVANSVSDTISVVAVNPVGQVGTLTGDSLFGPYDLPSGVTRTPAGQILVVDQKATTFPGTPSGRGTIRVIDPQTLQTVDGFRDASPTAQYTDVVTAHGRIWVADAGDQGVAVVFPPSAAAPWSYPRTLIYQGGGDFADFIEDESDEATPPAPKTFLLQPRRLATDGSTRVVVADAGSDVVTIIDAQYAQESLAILRNVDLGLAAGQTVSDVAVAGGFAYAVSSSVATLFRINLTTFAVDTLALGGLLPGGLGVTSDGELLYAGAAAGGDIREVNLDPTGVAAPALGALIVGVATASPFGFLAAPVNANSGSGSTPTWISTSTGSSSESNDCGLLGAEALLLVLGAAAFVRRRP